MKNRSSKKSRQIEFNQKNTKNTEEYEEYMSDDQLAHFKELLINWRAKLETNTVSIGKLEKDSDNLADFADRAGKEEKLITDLAKHNLNIRLLKEIEASMERIANKNYGYCLNCGNKIGIKRLEVYLTATQCIECQYVSEQKEKRYGAAFNPIILENEG